MRACGELFNTKIHLWQSMGNFELSGVIIRNEMYRDLDASRLRWIGTNSEEYAPHHQPIVVLREKIPQGAQTYPWMCRGFMRILDAQEIGADRVKTTQFRFKNAPQDNP